MHIVDTALQKRADEGKPVRVGVIGAGAMARGFVNQTTNAVPGMVVAAISNRTVSRAIHAYDYAGVADPIEVEKLADFEDAVSAGQPVVTDDPLLLCQSEQIDALIDITGDVNFGAQLALDAIEHKKSLILMNAEVDATIGPILHHKAREAGVLFTLVDGDQPGVQMNLYRYVRGLGLTPRVLGNVKGLQDEYRTPTTQQAFAEQWNQDPWMVTSFADGSKVNFEQCLVANATGFTVPKRGLNQWEHRGHVDEMTSMYDIDQLRELGGIVDYVVGALPSPGVYCMAEQPDERQHSYLALYKLGEGPLYSFYWPYHLCHFEAPSSVARAVLFDDPVGQPLGAPTVEVVALAKRDLSAGETLDKFGGYMSYGQSEAAPIVQAERLLPQGLTEGCVLTRNIAKDEVISWDDVDAPVEQLAHRLYAEQSAFYFA